MRSLKNLEEIWKDLKKMLKKRVATPPKVILKHEKKYDL